ncbi:xanthine phosphoribosyltransferase [Paenibacillus kyungheensis]
MKELQERIRQEGQILSEKVLKVDSFLNHQVDTQLAVEIGKEFARLFAHEKITKVLTIEASGIQFAMATGIALGVPFVYAKKKKAITQGDVVYAASVHSFTKQETYQVTIVQSYLNKEDRILIVDDFLATGAALVGLADIVKASGATLVGVGCVIEKTFQEGRGLLEERQIPIQSLARISSMSPGHVDFIEETPLIPSLVTVASGNEDSPC